MQHRYFSASNSASGFKNYFPEVFLRAEHLYIIKGGPGTGKSSFMKRCALTAQKISAEVEYYYCSSDPESLDGLLILGKNRVIGIIDGTSPHAYEPKIAGACEEIINLGQFWQSDLLVKQKNEIKALSQRKSSAYERAYDYLRSCGNLRAVTDSLLEDAIYSEKMSSAVKRLVRSLPLSSGKATKIPSLISGVTMSGRSYLDSFEQNAETIYRIGELYGVGRMFLLELSRALESVDCTLRMSYDPVKCDSINGIFIEEQRIAFLLSGKEELDTADRFVNTKRFIDTEGLKKVRPEIRYAEKIYSESLEGAIHALGEAKIYHFLLEDIYKNAMDFRSLSRFTDSFAENLVNIL